MLGAEDADRVSQPPSGPPPRYHCEHGSLPNFLLIGAPRFGTTSLYHYLRARQLVLAGERVAALVMIDAFNRSWARSLRWPTHLRHRLERLVRRGAFHLRSLLRRTPGDQVRYAKERLHVGAEPRAGVYRAPAMGWRDEIFGEARVYEIPDRYRGLLTEPPVREVAARVRPWLEGLV